jgi:predicted nucleic acid-binding protein
VVSAGAGTSTGTRRISGRSFLGSNLLVYNDDHGSPAKREAALELVERCRRSGTGVLSVQVLQEYFAIATRKLSVDPAIAKRKVELFAQFPVVATQPEDVLAAIDLQTLHRPAFWDALIVRAALKARCDRLLTEDMQGGRRISGLEIVNPLRLAPPRSRASRKS